MEMNLPASVSATDREIFKLFNDFRMNPKSAIPHLQEMLKHFDGKKYKPPTGPSYQTNKGVLAVQEAIDYLASIPPAPAPLQWNEGLAAASKALVDDLGPAGLVQMNTQAGVTPLKRIE